MTTSQNPEVEIRNRLRQQVLAPESQCLADLSMRAAIDPAQRERMVQQAITWIEAVRRAKNSNLMEAFMAQYGLTTEEGLALMCLAEALLRVPDAATVSALIDDKISPYAWRNYVGEASSALVNASTLGLWATSEILKSTDQPIAKVLRQTVKKLGEPVVRRAVALAMKELGRQFVLGQTMPAAIKQGKGWQNQGYTYSFDMLGEAAKTEADAQRYFTAYRDAIDCLAGQCHSNLIEDNPGISVKLSALYARYEPLQKAQVMTVLVERTRTLARLARASNMGFNIDAEESDRLDLSLDVIEAVLSDPELAGWDGFGVVVQAYNKRASAVIDWLHALALRLDRRLMVRLVKGAYWDAEIKRAQVLGLAGFPLFTRKAATDLAYISCAKQLFDLRDQLYPQFATHNAHTLAAVLELAPEGARYEFQRLHGMGENLHAIVRKQAQTRCRIYAPVGSHEELLAYLVRRLLENGANSSFVNQIGDANVRAADLAQDPFAALPRLINQGQHRAVRSPLELFGSSRANSLGVDLNDVLALDTLDRERTLWVDHLWQAAATVATGPEAPAAQLRFNPANLTQAVGRVSEASIGQVETALDLLEGASPMPKAERLQALRTTADLFESHYPELFALLAREAGKTLADAVGEVREAIDFLRYYADQAEQQSTDTGLGLVVCISPWNFPLAIFVGQVAAALAMGNRVIAKPAEQTPLIAARAVALMYEAGIARDNLVLLPGSGVKLGNRLLSDARIKGVCFTGSTGTAQIIHKNIAAHLDPSTPLVAETGGLNAMIVDSTALPEQAVRDIVASGFQSAGQRCSALRMLYIQDDIADKVIPMLKGAMDLLTLGDCWHTTTDVGPLIDAAALTKIQAYIDQQDDEGNLIKQMSAPSNGYFVGPALIRVTGIADLGEEIFGPVIHVARFKAADYDGVIKAINDSGYGLTFCLHSRIEQRIAQTCQAIKVGNTYINRNQIGAVVGSQPFGGEGCSGTGPKAGGPHYLPIFTQPSAATEAPTPNTLANLPSAHIQQALAALIPASAQVVSGPIDLPGPTGESNRLTLWSRGVFICLGPDAQTLQQQYESVRAAKGRALLIGPDLGVPDWLSAGLADGDALALVGQLDPADLASLSGFIGLLSNQSEPIQRALRQALAHRAGALLPLLTVPVRLSNLVIERHVSIDTTASGGNAELLTVSE
ncbi:bifunctional proline dehydrogenase/L-glutamate gamma-semialdehyde dehydrogenase PutA [Reinekea sp.]|jgi:RHH-type proline utilization regulon transcriptional repressor/proline dehydrogenase/delta 1-pyrroline-5-carboxylate dehydrogenase|uniref:bifunctional proline dehydrogenase/L-glutamate gamma-semialdehyde dehydrogenase PutA n=1 Tax=Reinekea sp. TaxID=1970455 RepID=UPI002A83E644|nr:bifunctional proline dehydrogenase/L-glutamate gamma-semialdehyde dehydrogenase PutA [Reinekea sp.]